MEGKSQRNLQIFLRQLPDSRHNAAGGDSDISLADVKSAFACEQPDKTDKIIIIVQRFAGTHYNHI